MENDPTVVPWLWKAGRKWRWYDHDVVNEIIRMLEWGFSRHSLEICPCSNCNDYRHLLNDMKSRISPPSANAKRLAEALADAGVLMNNVNVVREGGQTTVVLQGYVLGDAETCPAAIRAAVKDLAEWTA